MSGEHWEIFERPFYAYASLGRNPPYFTRSPYGSCDVPAGRESSSLTPSLGRGAKLGPDGKLNPTQSAYQPVKLLGQNVKVRSSGVLASFWICHQLLEYPHICQIISLQLTLSSVL